MRWLRAVLLSGAVAVITGFGLYLAVGGTGVAQRAGQGAAPNAGGSETLESAPQLGVNTADGLNYFSQAPLVLSAVLVLGLAAAGWVWFRGWDRRQKSRALPDRAGERRSG